NWEANEPNQADKERWDDGDPRNADKPRSLIQSPPMLNVLRVGPKSSLTQTKLSGHETNRGEAEKSECVSGEIFEILGQAAAAIEPREGALDNPAPTDKTARTASSCLRNGEFGSDQFPLCLANQSLKKPP